MGKSGTPGSNRRLRGTLQHCKLKQLGSVSGSAIPFGSCATVSFEMLIERSPCLGFASVMQLGSRCGVAATVIVGGPLGNRFGNHLCTLQFWSRLSQRWWRRSPRYEINFIPRS